MNMKKLNWALSIYRLLLNDFRHPAFPKNRWLSARDFNAQILCKILPGSEGKNRAVGFAQLPRQRWPENHRSALSSPKPGQDKRFAPARLPFWPRHRELVCRESAARKHVKSTAAPFDSRCWWNLQFASANEASATGVNAGTLRCLFPSTKYHFGQCVVDGVSQTDKRRSSHTGEAGLRLEYNFPSESRHFRANVLGAWNEVWLLVMNDIHRFPGVQLGTNHTALVIKEKQ